MILVPNHRQLSSGNKRYVYCERSRKFETMKLILLFVALLFSSVMFAQEVKDDVLYEFRGGKKYIVHYAQAGNTLWGLHTTYNVAVNDIVSANPGIDKGVQEGYKYLIPVGLDGAKNPDGTQQIVHTVAKGETLFGLSKKYNVSSEELTKLNPSIASGLKPGQELTIPVKANTPITINNPTTNTNNTVTTTVTFSDSLVTHVVKPSETLYTISKRFMVPVAELQKLNNLKSTKINEGDVLKIPLRKENVKQVEVRQVQEIEPPRVDEELLFKKKANYKIAVLLPFDLNSKGQTQLNTLATEVYMGMQLAIDSLNKEGVTAEVRFIDFPLDSLAIAAYLKKPEMQKLDLVIGPLLPQSVDQVAKWCKLQQVRMICPAAINSAILKGNPFVYAAVSSEITQMKALAVYTLDQFAKDQIVLVNTGVAKDKDLYDAYRNRFMELSPQKGNVKLIEIKVADLAGYIRKNGNTVFVVPTRDKGAAIKFVQAVHKNNAKAGDGTITILGTKDWAGFDDISGYYKTKYAISWSTASDLNYTLPATKQLLYLYRTAYKADMNKFGAQGFDVMYYFLKTLLMEEKVKEQVINAFNLEKVATGSGYENKQCFIVKHVDYELVRAGIYHE